MGRPVGTAQPLLQLGRLVMPQDGSIVGGQLPLLGPQEALPGCGGGSMGRSCTTSAVVHRLVVAPDSTWYWRLEEVDDPDDPMEQLWAQDLIDRASWWPANL